MCRVEIRREGGGSARGLWQQLPKEPHAVRIPCQLTLASSSLLLSTVTQNYIMFFFLLNWDLMLMVLCGTKTPRRFLPQDGHSLSMAQPLGQDTERRLACAVVLVSLRYQSLVQRVKQWSSSLPSPSSGEIVYWGDWQTIQKRNKYGKAAAGLIMEGGWVKYNNTQNKQTEAETHQREKWEVWRSGRQRHFDISVPEEQ